MKLLVATEATFVIGGAVREWPAPTRTGLRTSGVTEMAIATSAQTDAEESQRRMAPVGQLIHRPPGFRFDADRLAPSGIDDDTYNGFNDQGLNV
jgi:hypothetical protein